MAKKHVAPHAKRLIKAQERHRKKVWATFKKLARHKGCYAHPKGGMLLYGMGFKGKHPKKKGGMMLVGMGMPKKNRKKIKLPAWVNKKIPKTGWPTKPAGFSKSAGAFWNSHRKKAKQAQAKAKTYLGRLWGKAKTGIGQLANHAVNTLQTHAGKLADQGMQFLSDHQDQFVDMAQTYMDKQGANLAAHASGKFDKYAVK